MSRGKSKAEKNYLATNTSTIILMLALMFFLSACGNTDRASTAQNTPWQLPNCDEPGCDVSEDLIFTGGQLTKGWIHSWNDDNKIQIGSGPDHPQGQIDIDYDDMLRQVSSFAMSFDNIESKVPSEIFDCYKVSDPQRISWRFDYVENNATVPDSHMRLIFLPFNTTKVATIVDNKVTPFGSGHLEILFEGEQLSWVRTFKDHRQLFEASTPPLCPKQSPATSNKERFPDCKGRACEDDFDPIFWGPSGEDTTPEFSSITYRCNGQFCKPGEEPDEIILQGNRRPQTNTRQWY